MNSATFAGRLGSDATLRKTQSGDSVLGFSLAVDERKGQEKSTLWVDCSVWGKRADALAQYMTKGTTVAVSGTVGIRQWEGNSGPRANLTVRVSELSLLGGKPAQSGAAPAPMTSGLPSGAPPAPREPAPDSFNDEIPFAVMLAPLAGLLLSLGAMAAGAGLYA